LAGTVLKAVPETLWLTGVAEGAGAGGARLMIVDAPFATMGWIVEAKLLVVSARPAVSALATEELAAPPPTAEAFNTTLADGVRAAM
jgi:hypothetical protein